jgi:hypothetical protein
LFALFYPNQIRPHIDTPEGFLQFAFFCTASNTAHVNTSKPLTFTESLKNMLQFGISFSEEEKSFLESSEFFRRHKDLTANFAGKGVF